LQRRRAAGCLVVSAIALAAACRRIDSHSDAGASILADGGADVAPFVLAARSAPASGGPGAHGDPAPRAPAAHGVPAGRGPHAPRRGLAFSHPADDRHGLAAIRRHRGAFLVRAVDPAGPGAAAAPAAAPLDRPRRPAAAPHRELLRRVMGL